MSGKRPIRVLVIDDEEDYRIIIRDLLAPEGYEILLARDGAEGLSAAKEMKPDLVLVDWMMPNLDGQGFVRELRRSPLKDLPVIMLTVKQTTDDELEALHFGVDDFLVKPFSAPDLSARVEAALRRAKS